jgi:hypothetical protein
MHRTAVKLAGFAAVFPTAGRDRLFLQYQVDGHVQTAEFTQEAGTTRASGSARHDRAGVVG